MLFRQDLRESFRIAATAVRMNKSRALLTTLGIVIGIMAVVTTMTAANGLGNSFRESISALGTDVLYVSRTPWIINGNWFDFRNREQLTLKDADKLSQLLSSARAINPTTSTDRPVKYRSTVLQDIDIVGTTDQHILISSALPEYGRFLLGSDLRYRKRICVIGSEIKERLFSDADPINKKIKIGRYNFLVVGVMEEQGGAGFLGGPNFDNQVYVPITTLVKHFGSANRHFNIAVKAPSQEAMADFEYELIGEMRSVRQLRPSDEDDFSINQMDTLVSAYNQVMGVIILIGLLITSISLAVGGIGVMNIMFVSVTERTREIGIRKAIGAKRRSILSQFLFESALICVVGGIFGILLSFLVTQLINEFLLPASLSLPIMLVAVAVSVLTGITAGLMPAIKASRLNPIEALRYE